MLQIKLKNIDKIGPIDDAAHYLLLKFLTRRYLHSIFKDVIQARTAIRWFCAVVAYNNRIIAGAFKRNKPKMIAQPMELIKQAQSVLYNWLTGWFYIQTGPCPCVWAFFMRVLIKWFARYPVGSVWHPNRLVCPTRSIIIRKAFIAKPKNVNASISIFKRSDNN